ncbi:unnamed protein product [Mytilus coruscus]|uniref:Uncharacterized protein n=1 Tax=Mytilus coruscus TaxID=42192 RepID=A0A6J8CGJ7_MYTCO|nr:unnamed protein product [Mytilus coruscus]
MCAWFEITFSPTVQITFFPVFATSANYSDILCVTLGEKGIRRRVQAQTNIPKNWHGFLWVDENKRELFQFLSEKLANLANTETVGENVISYQAHIDKSKLQPCKHEEADTRVMIHVADAVRDGFKNISIKTVVTDVIVIAISVFKDTKADEIWIAWKHFRYIPIHDIAQSLGPLKSRILPIFQAFTGCDTVSSFAGRGKKTAWDIWNAFPRGLDTHKVLGLLRQEENRTKVMGLFSGQVRPMTVIGLRNLLNFKYSEGNSRLGEIKTGHGFLTFLQAASKKTDSKAHVNGIVVSLEDILMWLSGARSIPATGFHKKIDDDFSNAVLLEYTCVNQVLNDDDDDSTSMETAPYSSTPIRQTDNHSSSAYE